MVTILKEVSSENPNLHWEFIECKDVVAVDLGCGRWGKVEYRDPSWPTTPEYLIQKGASHVYAFDIDPVEIDWYTANISTKMNVTAYCKAINTVDDVREILTTLKPKSIKIDIEGYEQAFLQLTDEEFCSIDFYAVETHSDALSEQFSQKFEKLNYEVVAIIDLIHARPMKAFFAKKIKS